MYVRPKLRIDPTQDECPPGCDASGVSDSDLMRQFYNSDDRSFNILTSRWWGRLSAFFRKLGFGADDAEDLTQETLVRLYLTREQASFNTGLDLRPYLFMCARNLAIEEWRRRRPGRESLPLSAALATSDRDPPVDEGLLADLFTCMWRLPEVELTYLLLCSKHGLGTLSHNEIAEVLGKWPAQLTLISQRTRERVRACMTGKGYR